MANSRKKKRRFRSGGFAPFSDAGTPIFELDGEQACEYGIEDPIMLETVVRGLIARHAWLMVIPPAEGPNSWTLLMQASEVRFVEEYLFSREKLYLTRGPHCPDAETEEAQ